MWTFVQLRSHCSRGPITSPLKAMAHYHASIWTDLYGFFVNLETEKAHTIYLLFRGNFSIIVQTTRSFSTFADHYNMPSLVPMAHLPSEKAELNNKRHQSFALINWFSNAFTDSAGWLSQAKWFLIMKTKKHSGEVILRQLKVGCCTSQKLGATRSF